MTLNIFQNPDANALGSDSMKEYFVMESIESNGEYLSE